MPVPPTLRSIVDYTVRGTRSSRVRWVRGATKQQFTAQIDDYAIVIEMTSVPKSTPRSIRRRVIDPLNVDEPVEKQGAIRFRILSAIGDDIDSFVVASRDDDYEELRRTWDQARVIAQGIKTDIDKLEEKLRVLSQ